MVLNATLMSVAFVVAVFTWFAFAIASYTGAPVVAMLVLLAIAAPLLQPQFLVFAVLRHQLAARGSGRVLTALTAASAWVATEWLCPRLFEDTLGHGLLPFSTLRQGADLAGAGGLTFVLLLVNEALTVAVGRGSSTSRLRIGGLATAVGLILLLAAYGSLRRHRVVAALPDADPFKVALIQANLGDYEGLRKQAGTFAAVRMILDEHKSLSRGALVSAGPEEPVSLLVWPETVYPTTFGKPKNVHGEAFDLELARFAASEAPLLLGTYDHDEFGEYNAAALLQRSGDANVDFEISRKTRLFPLTENVPAWMDSSWLRDRFPWLGRWQPGRGPALFRLLGDGERVTTIAPLICLDAVDPGLAIGAVRSGAELLVNLSNDAWFGASRGARLHLTVSAFRSIETRLPQLRATNTGISAIISPLGEIEDQTVTGETAVLVGSVIPGSRGGTLMVRWGEWFGPATLFFVIASLLAALRKKAPSGA